MGEKWIHVETTERTWDAREGANVAWTDTEEIVEISFVEGEH